ncbi:MAG: biopolymer transporter ExbD [Deltaproteobacteria bacterium]|nr:biopolymer transporter ExbD [Deltaproteobacteria bacterium]MBN2670149.1 biopolymer transporter ExbD [Deltaproteobacteria bacterium]
MRRRRDKDEGIDIAPLIDVVFILLIFFMVSTTFVRNLELDIERPSAASVQTADIRAVRVTLTRDGQVMVEGQEVSPWMVQNHVRTIALQHPERPVLVTADENAPTGKLVDVVDQCRLAGAKHVGVDVARKE